MDLGWSQRRADGMIALVACAWGCSYLLMKVGLAGIPPFCIIALRFGIAFAAVAVVFRKKLARTTASTLRRGALMGLFLFGLFAFLMHGLQYTSASNGGFLTATTVVFVPVINAVILRRKPAPATALGVCTTLAGIALLSLQGSLALHPGDALCLVGALVYAGQILLTDRFSHEEDGVLLGVWQLGFAALFGLVCTLLFETPALPGNAAQWGAILGLALVCSAFGFVVQPVAQRFTTPEHTGLLFALEPLFSAVFAFVFLGEKLSAQGYVGAALVLAGVVVAALPSRAGKGAVALPAQAAARVRPRTLAHPQLVRIGKVRAS